MTSVFDSHVSVSKFYELVGSKFFVCCFVSSQCKQCAKQKLFLDVIAPVFPKFSFVYFMLDDFSDLAVHFSIRSVPTIIIFNQKKIVYRASGLHDVAKLQIILCGLLRYTEVIQ